LDASFVKRLLDVVADETLVENAFNDEHEDVWTLDFSNEPPLTNPDEIRRWPNRAFKNAEDWLSKRTPEQFDSVRKAGLCADLCVANYTGLFPAALLKEILRLGLDSWVFNLVAYS
jgi:hypothetical protein